MNDGWQQFYRKPAEPDIHVGDLMPGMEQDTERQWVGIIAPVEAVEVTETRPDGSRFYRVKLGKSIPVETRRT